MSLTLEGLRLAPAWQMGSDRRSGCKVLPKAQPEDSALACGGLSFWGRELRILGWVGLSERPFLKAPFRLPQASLGGEWGEM